MKLGKLSLGIFVAVGIAVAASPTYKINIPSDTWVGDTQLKAGDYKVSVDGDKATFTMGKKTFQVPASMEQGKTKSHDTLLETTGSKLTAIDIGGSTTKIMIKDSKGGTAKAQ